MTDAAPPQTQREPEKPRPGSPKWRRWLARPGALFFVALLVSQLAEKVIDAFSPETFLWLQQLNADLAAWAEAINPWEKLDEFLAVMRERWPDNPLKVPIHLVFGSFWAALTVIFGSFIVPPDGDVQPGIVLPSLIGYAAGLLITHRLHSRPGKGLNPIVGAVGTILYGSLFLAVFQPVMYASTAAFGRLLGTVSAGVGSFTGLWLECARWGKEALKDLFEEWSDRKLKEVAEEGSKALPDLGRLRRASPKPFIIGGVACVAALLFIPPEPVSLPGTRWKGEVVYDPEFELSLSEGGVAELRSRNYYNGEEVVQRGTWKPKIGGVTAVFVTTIPASTLAGARPGALQLQDVLNGSIDGRKMTGDIAFNLEPSKTRDPWGLGEQGYHWKQKIRADLAGGGSAAPGNPSGTRWKGTITYDQRDITLAFEENNRVESRSQNDKRFIQDGTWRHEGGRVYAEFGRVGPGPFAPVKLEGAVKSNKIEGHVEYENGFRHSFIVRRVYQSP
jgi:hypothetical protein